MFENDSKITLGISTCLLGRQVRFDGGHKHDRFLTDTLGRYVTYVPVCPETECGLPVPREAMRLTGDPASPRLVTVRTKIDHTLRMKTWAEKKLRELEKENLCGFIFKSKSPSSGMERVKVYNDQGIPSHNGVGIFARAFMDRFPLYPVEEEGRLHDPVLRENFIERIFVFNRWRNLLSDGKSRGGLVDFHTRHKLLILSHSTKHYQHMGKMVAAAKKSSIDRVYEEYQQSLMDALSLKTTPKKNTNVLHHVMGFFKKDISADEKKELLEIISRYHEGYVPLVVPLTLINHYVRKYNQPYLQSQYYLNPHPVELQLRNHV